MVECLKNAEDCVKYLRQHNIGRASFIALDKMQEHRGARQRPFQCPAQAERLFDLITPKDEKFLDAFYFALKDTLVAGDIKIGTQIAFNAVAGKKFRVVTLAGEMIELSGVMSGGGRPKKGLMGNKIVEEFS